MAGKTRRVNTRKFRRSALVIVSGIATLGQSALPLLPARFDLAGSAIAQAPLPTETEGPTDRSNPNSPTVPQARPGVDSVPPDPAAIRTLQQELQRLGYYSGPIDGLYGPGTAAAVQEFRAQQEQATGEGSVLFSGPDDSSAADGSGPDPAGAAAETESSTGDSEAEAPGAAPIEDTRINPPALTEPSAPPSDAASDAAVDESPAGIGFSGILLALLAAAGSFAVGFVLASRRRSDQGASGASPDVWGDLPEGIPQTNSSQKAVGTREAAGYGASSMATTVDTLGVAPPEANSDSSADMGITTRLPRASLIEELVSELQVVDASKRHRAIWELGQRGNSAAVQPLVNAMVDADSKEKSLILAALSEIGMRSLKPMNRALAIALQDENPEVRKNAIRDLTRVYDLIGQISQMLGHATKDDDGEVRRTAGWALQQLNRIRQAPQLEGNMPEAISGQLSEETGT